MKNYFKRYYVGLRKDFRNHRKMFIFVSVLWFLILCVLIRSMFSGNFENVALCLLTILLFLLPPIVEDRFKIVIPVPFQVCIYVFIFASEILGEIDNFYTLIPFWDTALHTVNGFLCAAVGFSLAHILNESNKAKVNLSPFFMALVGFSFSMTIGVLWEFFEFGMDKIFYLDMQKDFIVSSFASVKLDPTLSQNVVVVSGIKETIVNLSNGEQVVISGGYLDIGIIDTMKDLLVNFVGATVFCIFGYLYEAQRNKTNFTNSLLFKKEKIL